MIFKKFVFQYFILYNIYEKNTCILYNFFNKCDKFIYENILYGINRKNNIL